MRETATVDYVNYFQSLGIGRRITWIDLWNKIAESSSWEMSVSLPYHTNAVFAEVTLFDKIKEAKVCEYKIPVKDIIDKDGDVIESNLAYELIKIVKNNKIFHKNKSAKGQSVLDLLRKKRDNLSVRIYNWKSQGRDVTELLKEMEEIKKQIKNIK